MNLARLIRERLTTDQQRQLEADIRRADPLTTAQRAQLVKDLERINGKATNDIVQQRERQAAAQARIDDLFRAREAAIVEGREVDRQAARAASGWARQRAPIEHALRESAAPVLAAFRNELLDLHDRDRSLARRGGFVDSVQVQYDHTVGGQRIAKPESVARVEEVQSKVGAYLRAVLEAYRSLDAVALTAADPEQAVDEIRERLSRMRQNARLEPSRDR